MKKLNPKIKIMGFGIAGCMFLLMSVIMIAIGCAIMASSQDNTAGIVVCAISSVYVGGAVGMFTAFGVSKKRWNMYTTYKNIVAGKPAVSLDGLAKTLGIPQRKVVQNLQFLISSGRFEFGYIDYEYGLFTLASDRLEYDKLKHRHVYKCQSCGGSTLLYDGDTLQCSYCGAPLKQSDVQHH